ncbi:MAG: alanine racemase [Sulfitobacter sp.]
MMRNVERLQARAASLGVALRPHLKTAKSIDVARHTLQGYSRATVSTVKEAEMFAASGLQDIVYAVGISPDKLPRIQRLREAEHNVKVLLDSVQQANACVAHGVPAFIEIDSDGHRGGLRPDDATLVEIGKILHAKGCLEGVLTHAGESYGASEPEERAKFAEIERDAAVSAARHLTNAGISCPTVSVGSTPTAHAATNLDGVTELRAGVYMFFDLVMAGINACKKDDIALSVLTTVIGHQPDRGWIICDAGWMALSRDRGTATQDIDQGYGLVCTLDGTLIPELMVKFANQEHGTIAIRDGASAELPSLPIGTRLRILPNHACATAAQHDHYNVLFSDGKPMAKWPRFNGW